MTEQELDDYLYELERKITDWKYDVKLSGKEEEMLRDILKEYEQLAKKLQNKINKTQ